MRQKHNETCHRLPYRRASLCAHESGRIDRREALFILPPKKKVRHSTPAPSVHMTGLTLDVAPPTEKLSPTCSPAWPASSFRSLFPLSQSKPRGVFLSHRHRKNQSVQLVGRLVPERDGTDPTVTGTDRQNPSQNTGFFWPQGHKKKYYPSMYYVKLILTHALYMHGGDCTNLALGERCAYQGSLFLPS